MGNSAGLRRAGAGTGTDPGQHAPVIGQRGCDDDAGGRERVEQEPAASRGARPRGPVRVRVPRPAPAAPLGPAQETGPVQVRRPVPVAGLCWPALMLGAARLASVRGLAPASRAAQVQARGPVRPGAGLSRGGHGGVRPRPGYERSARWRWSATCRRHTAPPISGARLLRRCARYNLSGARKGTAAEPDETSHTTANRPIPDRPDTGRRLRQTVTVRCLNGRPRCGTTRSPVLISGESAPGPGRIRRGFARATRGSATWDNCL